MADIPAGDRPRERLLAHGPRHLSSAELLALLLNTGQGAGKLSAVGLGQLLLAHLSHHDADPLSRLREVEAGELTQVDGIGPAKAATILAAIELGRRVFLSRPSDRTTIDSPAIAASIFSAELMWAEQEHFGVLLLDVKNRPLGQYIATKGTATETLSHPRETFKAAIRQGASSILVAHNHPSGMLEPSPEDRQLTQQLLQASQFLDIPLHDHLILGGGKFVSLREITDLWEL
ncbi:DNA repair protein RadC [Synechococcus sp. PCC 7336]|uniref:RadC family protein n=1 Tax=Synechococcus sp. PCC 7336 TaxID=195250 RepID=UPI000375F518|nr:DNA repair protein RadC [Synechococcus sp. PCC 7336]